MIFVLFSANILFVLTVCSNAKPKAFDGNGIRYDAIPQQFAGEESHPYEVVAEQAQAPLEVSDDDQYEETRQVAVVAVPEGRPRVYQLINNERDLSASATDLDGDATYEGQGGGGGGGHGGWLDMGAYSSGKGAFGWYADYPVAGGHGFRR